MNENKRKDLGKRILAGFKTFFSKNIALKIISLAFAVLLWGYVMMETDPERTKIISDVTVSFDGEDELQSKNLTVQGNRSQLLPSFERVKPQGITPDFRIAAECFRLSLQQGKRKNFTLHYGEDEVTLYYPPFTDFSSKAVQTTIRNGITRAMKHNAALMLPPVLEMFAQRHRLTYKKVKINGARRRWGSCTAAGTINLSCYLMLLPPHLSDYVLLHELAHTVEMNHGPRFWRLLDSFTDNKALALRKELRNYRLPF